MSKKPDGTKTVGTRRYKREYNPDYGCDSYSLQTIAGRAELKKHLQLFKVIDSKLHMQAAIRHAKPNSHQRKGVL